VSGAFSFVTTSEKKTSFLLIEVFSKLFNTQNYGRQGSILGGLSYVAELNERIYEELGKVIKCKWVNK